MNLSARNARGRTGLALAIMNRHAKVVAELMEPMRLTPSTLIDDNGNTVLMAAAAARDENIVRMVLTFLTRDGAKISAKDLLVRDDFGRTALILGIENPAVTLLLLKAGSNPNAATSGNFRTPLHVAVKAKAMDSIKHLMAFGARTDLQDNRNKTPSCYADAAVSSWIQTYQERIVIARQCCVTLLAIGKWKRGAVPRDVWNLISRWLWQVYIDDGFATVS